MDDCIIELSQFTLQSSSLLNLGFLWRQEAIAKSKDIDLMFDSSSVARFRGIFPSNIARGFGMDCFIHVTYFSGGKIEKYKKTVVFHRLERSLTQVSVIFCKQFLK